MRKKAKIFIIVFCVILAGAIAACIAVPIIYKANGKDVSYMVTKYTIDNASVKVSASYTTAGKTKNMVHGKDTSVVALSETNDDTTLKLQDEKLKLSSKNNIMLIEYKFDNLEGEDPIFIDMDNKLDLINLGINYTSSDEKITDGVLSAVTKTSLDRQVVLGGEEKYIYVKLTMGADGDTGIFSGELNWNIRLAEVNVKLTDNQSINTTLKVKYNTAPRLEAHQIPLKTNKVFSGAWYGNDQWVNGAGEFNVCQFMDDVTLYVGFWNITEVFNISGTEITGLANTAVTNVAIPEGITAVSGLNNSKLVSVVIPSTVTEIKSACFSGCSNLESVIIHENAKMISFINTFSGCSKLKNITLPVGVQTIDSSAFANTAIEEIIIPHTVTTVGDSSFANCLNLKVIYIPSDCNVKTNAFDGCGQDLKIEQYDYSHGGEI